MANRDRRGGRVQFGPEAAAGWAELSPLEQTRVELALRRVSVAHALNYLPCPFFTHTYDLLVEGEVGEGGVPVFVRRLKRATSSANAAEARGPPLRIDFTPEADAAVKALAPTDRDAVWSALRPWTTEPMTPGTSVIVTVGAHLVQGSVAEDAERLVVQRVSRARSPVPPPNEPK